MRRVSSGTQVDDARRVLARQFKYMPVFPKPWLGGRAWITPNPGVNSVCIKWLYHQTEIPMRIINFTDTFYYWSFYSCIIKTWPMVVSCFLWLYSLRTSLFVCTLFCTNAYNMSSSLTVSPFWNNCTSKWRE